MASSDGKVRRASPYVTGGGGFGLERAYGAVALTALLLKDRFPGLGDDAVVCEVRMQQHATALVDDLVLVGETPTGKRQLFLAVRKAPRIVPSDQRTVALFADFVQMMLAHGPQFESGQYRLGLAVDSANASVTELRELTSLTRRHANSSEFRRAVAAPRAMSNLLRKRLTAVDTILSKVEHTPKADGDGTQDLTWRLLCALHVVDLRLDGDNAADRTQCVNRLQQVVAEPARANDLWNELTTRAHQYAVAAGVVDRKLLRRDVAGHIASMSAADQAPHSVGLPSWSADLDMRTRFLRAAHWFTGRAAVLHEITRWLASDDEPALVVTGDPGSGKTAVLGLVAALSDHEHRPGVARRELSADVPEGAVRAAIHAGTLPSRSVLAAIADAAGVLIDPAAPTSDQIDAIVTAASEFDDPVVLAIDGLDEAADPTTLAESVIRPLLDTTGGGLRLLLGSRKPLIRRLGPGPLVVDLDDPRYVDPAACRRYIRRILLNVTPASSYRSVSDVVLTRTTEAIAAAAGTSFLLARNLAHSLAAAPTPADIEDPAWAATLPRTAGEAMRTDLHHRLGADAQRARELLLPLAYAQGRGLPWEDIWLPMVNGLTNGTFTDEDLRWLRREAGFYLTETVDDAGTRFRLFHQALAEDLLQERTVDADQKIIFATLLEHVPAAAGGTRDWAAAHPYLHAHLATHAATGDRIDQLLDDVGYLLCADRARLLPALATTRTSEGRVRAEAYRRAAHQLGSTRSMSERAAYLELAARRIGDLALADGLAPVSATGAWSCRWARWSTESEHRVLARYQESAGHVRYFQLPGGQECVANFGQNDPICASLDVHDLATGDALYPRWARTNWQSRVVGDFEFIALADGTTAVVTLERANVIDTVRRLRAWDLANDQPLGLDLTSELLDRMWVTELKGTRVAVAHYSDHTVRCWDLLHGAAVGQPLVLGEELAGATCAQLADGRTLLVAMSVTGMFRSWDLATGSLVAETTDDPYPASLEKLVAARRHDGSTVILSADRRYSAVFTWDPLTAEPASNPWQFEDTVDTLAVIPQPGKSSLILVGTDNGAIRVVNLDDKTDWCPPLSGHPFWTRPLAGFASKNGGLVVLSAGSDNTVRMWSLPTSDSPQAPPPSTIDVHSLASMSTQKLLVGGSRNGEVHVWDTESGALLHERRRRHDGIVWTATTTELADGTPVIVTGGNEGLLNLWDTASGQLREGTLAACTGPVFALTSVTTPTGHVLAAGGLWPTLRLYDVGTGTLRHESRPCTDPQAKTQRVPNGIMVPRRAMTTALTSTQLPNGRNVIISGSADGILRLWNPHTGRRLGRPMINGTPQENSRGEISVISCHTLPDGRHIAAVGSEDERLTFWDLLRQCPIAEITDQDWIRGAVGIQLANGRPGLVTGRRTLTVWDLSTLPDTAAEPLLPSWQDGRIHPSQGPGLLVEIELDSPVNTLVADTHGIVVGTPRGVVHIRLHPAL